MTCAVPMKTRTAAPAFQHERRCLGVKTVLALIVLLGLVIRVLYGLAPHVAFGDESCYVWLAQNLCSGQGYNYYNGQAELHFPPLFPLVLGALHWVVRDWEAVTRIAFALFGCLLALPVYRLASRMYSERAGLGAALLTAIAPAFTSGVLFAETLSEPLYLLCMFSGLAFAYTAGMERRLRDACLAGAFLALANLTRSEGQLYFLVGAVFLVGAACFLRPRRIGRGVLVLAAYGTLFLAVCFPYVLYLHSHTGLWALDTKSTTSYTTTRALVAKDGIGFQRDTWGLNDRGEVNYYAHEFGQPLSTLLLGKYQDRVWSDIKTNFATARAAFLRPQVFGRWLLVLAGVGLCGALWVHRRVSAEALNLLVLGSLGAVLVFFITERFLYGLLLPLLLWAGVGLDCIARWGESWSSNRSRYVQSALQAGLVAGLGIFTAYTAYQGYLYWQRKSPEQTEVLAAAKWLRENTPADAVIMAANTEVAFHAGRKWLPVPVASRERVVKYGEERGATHLTLRGRYLERRPEQNRELFEGARDFDDLQFLTRFGVNEGEPRFVVYALKAARKHTAARPR